MKPIIIKHGGVKMKLPMEKLPTRNKEVNRLAANQLITRLKKDLEGSPSVGVLDEYATIIRDKFPYKIAEYGQIMDQAMKNFQPRA